MWLAGDIHLRIRMLTACLGCLVVRRSIGSLPGGVLRDVQREPELACLGDERSGVVALVPSDAGRASPRRWPGSAYPSAVVSSASTIERVAMLHQQMSRVAGGGGRVLAALRK